MALGEPDAIAQRAFACNRASNTNNESLAIMVAIAANKSWLTYQMGRASPLALHEGWDFCLPDCRCLQEMLDSLV